MNIPNLYIIKKNKFGDILYGEIKDKNYKREKLPNIYEVWAIKNPSKKTKEYYEKCEIRIYNNIEYLMSKKASEVISKESNCYGSCGIVSFCYNKKRYFIMNIDNKRYIQNPQGGINDKETAIDCIIREINEELKIIILKEQCKEIGFWSLSSSVNELVETKFHIYTTLFFIDVTYEQIKHLIIDNLKDFNIIPVKKYNFKLDETQYVIISEQSNIEKYNENIQLIKKNKKINHNWNGHHRQAILSLLNINKYDISYLNDFSINYNLL
jgi:8-oxo-dGTP pyrophosphatase MutT (NUDIX family)